jgi:hypothetical protein
MTTPSKYRTVEAELDVQSDLIALWAKSANGGTIVCKTPGAAMSLRYRLYRARKYLQMQSYSDPQLGGRTLYDHLVIQLVDNRLLIKPRNSVLNEVEFIPLGDPDNPNPIEETAEGGRPILHCPSNKGDHDA